MVFRGVYGTFLLLRTLNEFVSSHHWVLSSSHSDVRSSTAHVFSFFMLFCSDGLPRDGSDIALRDWY